MEDVNIQIKNLLCELDETMMDRIVKPIYLLILIGRSYPIQSSLLLLLIVLVKYSGDLILWIHSKAAGCIQFITRGDGKLEQASLKQVEGYGTIKLKTLPEDSPFGLNIRDELGI